MGNRKAAEALRITGRGGGNQGGKEPQIDGEGGRGLRGAQERETAKDGEGGTKASAESSTSVVDRAAQTQAPQGGREAGLHIGSRRKTKREGRLCGRPNQAVKPFRLRTPKGQRGGTHEVVHPNHPKRKSKKKESSLGVLKPGQGLKHAHKALERALDK
jgi:hypothetical protein